MDSCPPEPQKGSQLSGASDGVRQAVRRAVENQQIVASVDVELSDSTCTEAGRCRRPPWDSEKFLGALFVEIAPGGFLFEDTRRGRGRGRVETEKGMECRSLCGAVRAQLLPQPLSGSRLPRQRIEPFSGKLVHRY